MNPNLSLPNAQVIHFSMTLVSPAGITLGLIALAALIFFWRSLYRGSSRHSDLLPPFVCVLILAGSYLYSRALFVDRSGGLAEFAQKTALSLLDELEQEVSQREKVLSAMVEHWGFAGRPTERVWKRDCETIVRNLDGVISIVWADANARVQWGCPKSAEARIKGFDLRADPERYARFLRVKESKKSLYTQTRQLPIGVVGFAFNSPVYHEGKFEGIIGGVFDTSEFFRSIFRVSDYVVRVYEEGRLIYDSGPEYEVETDGPHRKWLRPVSFRHDALAWDIWVIPNPETIARERALWPEIALWLGIAFALLLAFVVRIYLKASESNNRLWVALESEKAIFEGTHLGVFTTGPGGELRTLNPAAMRIVGYDANDLHAGISLDRWHLEEELQKRAATLSAELGSTVAPGLEALLAKARVGGVDRNEWEIVAKGGQCKQVTLSMHALHAVSGKLDGFVGVIEDVTELKAQAKELTLQRAKIAESSKLAALGEMAGGVAHEINNPLAVISGKAQILRILLDHPVMDKDAMGKQVDAIRATVKRITRVISGMQSFGRDATKDPFSRTTIGSIIDDTIAFCAERFRNHSVELRLNLEVRDFEIACRPSQIAQVLLNLLNNAFDAVAESPGDRPKWVELRTRVRGESLECSVADSGPGIPPELRDRVMLPFFTTKAVGKGTGLGLSIAHGIVVEHGGRIILDEDRTATRFLVILPSAPARTFNADASLNS
jgi:PAS domain S-box-containing protein